MKKPAIHNIFFVLKLDCLCPTKMGQSRSYFVKGNVSEAHRITEYGELEMTHKDHRVQVVTFHT